MRLNLASHFVDLGHDVDLVLSKREGPYVNQVPAGVNIIDLNTKRVSASLPALVGYLKRRRPTALLSAMEHTNIIALLSIKLSRVKSRVVVSTHNNLSITTKKTNRRARLLPYLARWCYKWADGVVAVSQGVADDLEKTLALPKSKIHIIHNPAASPDIDHLACQSVEHPWFMNEGIPIILSAGRMTAQKDYPTLIHAFSLVKKARPVRLVILGEGGKKPELEAMVDNLELANSVSLPGFTDNPYAYMSKASVFVLSSAWEGFGNVLVEAMAVGTPVVSTNCQFGPAEILDNGKYGHLTPVGDPKALADAIIDTLDNPINHSALKQRAEEFKTDRIANKYLELLIA
jgi:glycosyltransferase involved in cell wall biosynthesis